MDSVNKSLSGGKKSDFAKFEKLIEHVSLNQKLHSFLWTLQRSWVR